MHDMKRLTVIAFTLGLALFIALLAYRGIGDLQAMFARVGWGITWLAGYYLVPLGCAAVSWRWLFPPGHGPRCLAALYATWIGLAVNWLLPVAQVGGEVVKVWLLGSRTCSTEDAFASVVIDKTLQVATQVVFTIIGLALFLTHYTQDDLVVGVVAGMSFLGVGLALFYRLQRRGLFAVLARFVRKFVNAARADQIKANADSVDARVVSTYHRTSRLSAAFAMRLTFRFALVGEVMIASHLLGLDIGLAEALIIESLIQAVRAGAFLIPAGLGAQEGAMVLLGISLGIDGDAALALALCKRARELMVGLPALGAWQFEQSRRAVASRKSIAQ